MTLEQIDAELREWECKLRSATDNMLELRDSPGYQRLRGEKLPQAVLTGVTAARMQPALDGLQTLWIYYALLRDTIGRALGMRAKLSSLLPSRAQLNEIERLLNGPSIELPAVATPLGERDLFAAANVARMIEPEKMLAAMHALFQQGRDAVVAIGNAWDTLSPKLSECEDCLEKLSNSELCTPNSLTTLRNRLAEVRSRCDSDPLAAIDELNEVVAQVAAIQSQADQLAARRRGVTDELQLARRLMAEVVEGHRQMAEIVEECDMKVCSEQTLGRPVSVNNGQAAALDAWLTKLEAEVLAGRWQPVRIGLERWNSAARQLFEADRQAKACGESLLNQRRDLRGLLGALKAKAGANGHAEDLALADLESQANALLATRPTPLEQLQRVVKEYQQRLL